jgi:hypothetical protein
MDLFEVYSLVEPPDKGATFHVRARSVAGFILAIARNLK